MTNADFTAAVLASPDDPGLRLAWADWLEENGDPRAEMLRLQIELTKPDDRVPHRDRLQDRLFALMAAGIEHPGPVWTNSLGMEFVYCPPGHFLMGSPPDEEGRHDNERQVAVELTRGFWLGRYLVTQAEYLEIRGHRPSWFQGSGYGSPRAAGLETDRFPVENVSADEAREFCRILTECERRAQAAEGDSLTAQAPPADFPAVCRYRLPTEAEWEYACRAGTWTAFAFGDGLTSEMANFEFALKRTSAVGSYPGNAWGLHDMHGNVAEWCQGRVVRPPSLSRFSPDRRHVDQAVRGGHFLSPREAVRSGRREYLEEETRAMSLGFRVALDRPPHRGRD